MIHFDRSCSVRLVTKLATSCRDSGIGRGAIVCLRCVDMSVCSQNPILRVAIFAIIMCDSRTKPHGLRAKGILLSRWRPSTLDPGVTIGKRCFVDRYLDICVVARCKSSRASRGLWVYGSDPHVVCLCLFKGTSSFHAAH